MSTPQIPVRLERMDGETEWKTLERLEHGDICRAFSLDPHRHRIDLPRTAANAAPGSSVAGFIFRDDKGDSPVATIHVARAGARFRDLDPLDMRDRLRLDKYV